MDTTKRMISLVARVCLNLATDAERQELVTFVQSVSSTAVVKRARAGAATGAWTRRHAHPTGDAPVKGEDDETPTDSHAPPDDPPK